MKAHLFLLITLGFLFACGKKIDINSYYDCNKKQNLDSGATAAKLLGSWKWSKRDCLDNQQSSPANQFVTVEFRADSTFRVRVDTSTVTAGVWKLALAETGIYRLELSKPSVFLAGRILLCNEEVLFNASYIDACDHLFKRY